MIRKLLSRLRGFRPGNNTRLSWRTLLHRPGGELAIGSDGLIFCRFCFDRPEARIIIGNRCFIGRSHIIAATHVEIENDVIISWGVTIVDHNSHALAAEDRADDVALWAVGKKDWSKVKTAPTVLKTGCWVGFNAIILKGVTIGEGAVVGAGSVVTRDVPAHSVVAGNPARVIRQREPAEARSPESGA
jgi:galactoside O-acetyltransferase